MLSIMKPYRWIILIGVMPVYWFFMMLFSTVVLRVIMTENWSRHELSSIATDVGDVMSDGGWWALVGPFWCVAIVLQVVFLLPVVSRRPPLGARGQSLVFSLLIGGLVAGVLSFGLICAVISACLLLADTIDHWPDWVVFVAPGAFVLSWIGWSALLLIYVRGIWADRILGRLVGVMIGGSILEILITVPIDIMVRRRTDCYCAEGTFFAFVASATALMWLAGPGVVIAIMSKRHRLWRETRCHNCGYEKGPSPASRCPECGSAWTA